MRSLARTEKPPSNPTVLSRSTVLHRLGSRVAAAAAPTLLTTVHRLSGFADVSCRDLGRAGASATAIERLCPRLQPVAVDRARCGVVSYLSMTRGSSSVSTERERRLPIANSAGLVQRRRKALLDSRRVPMREHQWIPVPRCARFARPHLHSCERVGHVRPTRPGYHEI